MSVTVTTGSIPIAVEPDTVNGTGPSVIETVNAPANGTVSVIGTVPAAWRVPVAAPVAAVSVTEATAGAGLRREAGGLAVLVAKFTARTCAAMAPASPAIAAALRKL